MNEIAFRKSLKELIRGGQAHVSVEKAIEGIKIEEVSLRADAMEHSIWEVFEHMRIAQEDILRYTLDAKWQSPAFPDGYWPSKINNITEKDWSESVSKFFSDLDEVIKLIEDSALDLSSEIPHGEGHTYLREILLVADHNAYHTAEIVHIRKALGIW